MVTLLLLGALQLSPSSHDSTVPSTAVRIQVDQSGPRPVSGAVIEVWSGSRLLLARETSPTGVVWIPWELAQQASALRLRGIGYQPREIPVALAVPWTPGATVHFRLDACSPTLTVSKGGGRVREAALSNPHLPACRGMDDNLTQEAGVRSSAVGF